MTQTIAVIGDIHCPYHDPRAVKIAVKILKDLEPHRVILIGDVVDFYSISRYDKKPNRINDLQSDCDQTHDLLTEIVSASTRSKYEYIEGNHENRLSRFLLTKAPELWSLRVLSVPELLRLGELGIEYKHETRVGNMTATHGHFARNHSGYTARAMAEGYGTVIFGHTHRLGAHYRRDGRGEIAAFENGCLCGLTPEFITGVADWQHGFSIITEHNGATAVEQVHILDGQAFFRGKRW